MGTKHAVQGRIEVQSDGVSGSAGYVRLTLMESATLSSNRENSVVPMRGTDIKTTISGQTEVDIAVEMTWSDSDPVVAVLEAAHWDKTHVGIKLLDDESGTGLTSDMLVENWQQKQVDGAQMVSLTLKPTMVDTAPVWA